MSEPVSAAETVELHVDGPVATLFLNRPEVRNAIDDDMRALMISHIEHVAQDDSVKALVITGRGKGFCSGGDIKAMKQRAAAPPGEIAINGWRRQQRTHRLVAALHDLPKPTIAAVNGAATGLGCDLALACDFIVAAEESSLAMTYVLRGLIPDGGGMYFLPRRVGLPRAKELIFSGRRVLPPEALAIGMVDRVCPGDSLLDEATAWARELSQGSSAALALAKTVLNQTFETTAEQVYGMGSQAQAICYSTREHQDLISEFLDKSKSAAPKAPR